MNLEPKIVTISLGGKTYLDCSRLLDFLVVRDRLIIEELRRRGTPLGDTEYLRGQSFELEIIKHAIQSSPQVS